MPEAAYRFADALGQLLACLTARAFESRWETLDVDSLAWDAVGRAWCRDVRAWETVLDEADGLLLRLLDRVPLLGGERDPSAVRVRTFRLAALERMQHATAAALVAQRYGAAGLRTVLADEAAPLARRYYAFFALAERHRPAEWPLFARYLTPDAHHAFVGTAAEAARFYPGADAAVRLVALFDAVRDDLHLRAFLGPRILESLFVLEDRRALPFLRNLLAAGHTNGDPERCEVTHALVMVCRLTGRLEPNSKYADVGAPRVRRAVEHAEAVFRRRSGVLEPVVVI